MMPMTTKISIRVKPFRTWPYTFLKNCFVMLFYELIMMRRNSTTDVNLCKSEKRCKLRLFLP
jgi:hypothetical protein